MKESINIKSVGLNIIFLDIDGVLNGYNKWTDMINRITKKLCIDHVFFDLSIKEKYVKRLYQIIDKTGARVVLTSSWRRGYWLHDYDSLTQQGKRLYDLTHKYNIKIIDITPKNKFGNREEEIQEWLDNTKLKINNFVILDDEAAMVKKFVGTNLVRTSSVPETEIIRGYAYENTGLSRKNVKEAINILNKERD